MTIPKASILILDDEERIRELLLEFLEDSEEFTVRASGSAEEALEELSREKADLCIVDVRLPGMHGEDFILTAKSKGLCSHFVMHTGSMEFTLSDALLNQGMTLKDLFLKPCDANDLLVRIRELLNLPGA